MANTSDKLVEIVGWLMSDNLLKEPEVELRARLLFLDTLGCMIAGLAKPELQSMTLELSTLDGGTLQLPGNGCATSIGAAVYLTGLAACWDEACEGLPRAHGRPGLHAFAAALPLALAGDHSLGEALAALVTGFEIAGRLGEMLRIPPGMHVDGTWGTFGSAAATACLLGLDKNATVAALQGAACHLPWSLYLPISEGKTVRNAYVGEAARRGLMQAVAAKSEITAPINAIETFDRLALGGEPTAKKLAPVGEWLILQGYLKPFAAVRHVHYGAQAALNWRRLHMLTGSQEILDLDLSIYGEAITYCGNRAPSTAIQAQFSLSYGLAFALVTGDLGPQAYDASWLVEPEVVRLETLVGISEDPRLTRDNRRAAILTVMTDNGKHILEVTSVPGDREMPLSMEEVCAKFIRYAGRNLGKNQATKMAEAILQAELSRPLQTVLSEQR